MASIAYTANIVGDMHTFSFTPYFTQQVLRKRPYLRIDWCTRVVQDPVRVEIQPDGRRRYWAPIAELGGRVLRVVTLPDGRTIHNAFPDRRFVP